MISDKNAGSWKKEKIEFHSLDQIKAEIRQNINILEGRDQTKDSENEYKSFLKSREMTLHERIKVENDLKSLKDQQRKVTLRKSTVSTEVEPHLDPRKQRFSKKFYNDLVTL